MFRPEELAQILAVFVDEAGEILTRMEQTTLTLEKAGPSPERLNSIFRGAHTLKGNASSLELQSIADMSHAMEDVLDQLRSGKVAVSPSLTSLLLSAIDAVREMLAQPERGAQPLDPQHRTIHRRLVEWSRASQGKEPKISQEDVPCDSSSPASRPQPKHPQELRRDPPRGPCGSISPLSTR